VDLKTAFRSAVRLSKIRHLRFHDMRHTFATRLVRAGVDLNHHSTTVGTRKDSHDCTLCAFSRR
jgi:integrase